MDNFSMPRSHNNGERLRLLKQLKIMMIFCWLNQEPNSRPMVARFKQRLKIKR